MLTTLLFFLLTTTFFAKADPPNETLKDLYKRYELGQITECELDGKTVYVASINAFDAPSTAYTKEGPRLFTCNYAWGQADKQCVELKNCDVIYRCRLHISGKRAIDKYKLGN